MSEPLSEIESEIERRMPLAEFLQIQERLKELRNEEQAKLNALAEIQQVYLSATNDEERELIRQTVADIRELSKIARAEIRSLNAKLAAFMSLDEASDLYNRYLHAKSTAAS